MRHATLFAIAALAVIVVAVASVSARSSGASGRTIRLVERGGTSVEIDNPPKGNRTRRRISVGDSSAGVVKLFDHAGKAAGMLHLACVATVGGTDASSEFQCTGSIRLAKGTLALSALGGLSSKADAKHIAVVGGTGSYEGASGSMSSSTSTAGATEDVIHLQRP